MWICLSNRPAQGGAIPGRFSDISILQRDSMGKKHVVTHETPFVDPSHRHSFITRHYTEQNDSSSRPDFLSATLKAVERG